MKNSNRYIRILFALFAILFSISISAQDEEYDPDYDSDYEVISVAGVKFNESKSKAISEFNSRFGYLSSEDSGSYITYYNAPTIGGIKFSYASFYFTSDKFTAASLIKWFPISAFNKAKEFRDNVAAQYRQKYMNMKSFVDSFGRRAYKCGMVENDRYPILIYITKGKSNGGQMQFYVCVDYYDSTESVNDDI